jgi:hypothetical protein
MCFLLTQRGSFVLVIGIVFVHWIESIMMNGVTHEGFWREVETETPTAGENRMDSFKGFLNKET